MEFSFIGPLFFLYTHKFLSVFTPFLACYHEHPSFRYLRSISRRWSRCPSISVEIQHNFTFSNRPWHHKLPPTKWKICWWVASALLAFYWAFSICSVWITKRKYSMKSRHQSSKLSCIDVITRGLHLDNTCFSHQPIYFSILTTFCMPDDCKRAGQHPTSFQDINSVSFDL